jgi:hypothetical protein
MPTMPPKKTSDSTVGSWSASTSPPISTAKYCEPVKSSAPVTGTPTPSATKGWIDEDAIVLANTIDLLDGGDTEHEAAKDQKKGFK